MRLKGGFRGLTVVLATAALFAVVPARAEHQAMAVFVDSTPFPSTPRYKAYSNTLGWGASSSCVTQAGGGWYVLKADPTRQHMILAFRSPNAADDTIYVQVSTPGGWGNTNTFAQDAAAPEFQKTFDVAYENTAGNGWVGYRSGATGGPSAYKWDGTSWVSQGVIGSGWPASGGIQWLRMETKVQDWSNEITLMCWISGQGLWATVYNGTSWSAATQLEVSPPPIADTNQNFDLTYEKTNGRCVALWVRDGSGSSNTFVSTKHLGGVWDSTATIVSTGTNLPTQEDSVRFVRLGASPATGSNEIMAVWLDSIGGGAGTQDANAMIWNGTSWGNAVELEVNATNIVGTNNDARPFDAVFNSTGTGFAVWNSAATTGVPMWKPWNGSWGANAAGVDIGAKSNAWIALGNPANSDVMIIGKDSNGANTVTSAQVLGSGSLIQLSPKSGSIDQVPNIAVEFIDSVAPGVPTGLGVSRTVGGAAVGSRLALSWTAGTEADLKNYRLHRSTNPGVTVGSTQTVVAAVVAAPGTTHLDGGLVNLATYYYRLTERDTSLNESGTSAEVSAYPADITAPAIPAGLGVSNTAGGSAVGGLLTLSWTANTETDLKDYRIFRSTASGFAVSTGVPSSPLPVATVAQPGTTHQDTGLTNGTTFYYRLTARDTTLNESGAAVAVSAYPADTTAPGVPTGLGVGNLVSPGGALRLSWTANTEGDRKDYRVYRSTNFGVTQVSSHVVAAVASPGTTHQDRGLTNDTTFYYRLTARDTTLNESGLSVEVSTYPYYVPDVTPPLAPTGLGAANPGLGQRLNLSWTANTEADLNDYRLFRSTNGNVTSGSSWTVIVAVITQPGTTHQDGGLGNGTTYYYKLSARDISVNESGLSTEVSSIPYDTTAPAAPAGLGVADVAADQGVALALSWTANTETDLKDYRIYRSTNGNVTVGSSWTVTPAAIAQPGTTHQDTGLTPVTTYYFKLTARDVSLNESAASSEVNARPVDNVAPTAPGAPTVTDAPSDEGVALRLNWTLNTEADIREYRVYRSTNFGVTQVSSHVVTTIASPGTTHQDAGLTPVTTYYYRLAARDTSANESALSGEANLRPSDNTAPTAPGAPTVADVPSDQGFALRLTWTLNTEPDVREYGVYRSTNGNVTASSSWTVLVTLVLSPGTTRQDGGLTNGVTYYYKLSARDTSGNESGLSAEAGAIPSDNTAPSAPTGLGVADVPSDEGTALRLSWTANTEADLKDYRIHRSTNGNVTVGSSWTVTLATIVQPGTTHQDTGLTPVTTYYYKMTARDATLDESAASSEVNLRPVDNTAPTAPVATTVADVPSDQGFALRLTWTLNTEPDVREYGVYRSTNGNVTVGSSWTVLVTLVLSPGTTRQDGGLTNGTTYYYKLSARDASGNESGLSAESSSIPYDNTAPAAPTGPGVAAGDGFTNLSWTANTEADLKDYRVHRSTNSGVTVGSSWTVTLGTILAPGTTHRDLALTNDTTYYYRFNARDTSLNASALSVEVSTWPRAGADTTPPAVPGGLGVASPGTGQRLTLSWSANTEGDLKDYQIHRSTNPGVVVGGTQTVVSAVIGTPGTTHQDAGLVNGTTYYYRLTARDTSDNESGGGTEVSGVVTDTTAPAAPAGVGVADVSGDQGTVLNLSWTANTESDLKDYRVHRSTNNGVTVGSSWTVTLATIVQPGTTHQDTGLTPVTTYYFKVTARDVSLNESAASGEVNARPVDNLAPSAPAPAPTVADVPSDQGFALRLTWTLNTEPDVREYGVYRSTNGNVTASSSWTVLVTLVLSPGTTQQDGGLTNGATYYYKLSTRDTSGNESGLSTEASGVPYDNTAPAAPTGSGATAGDGLIDLSWTANTEADLKDYRIHRSTNTGVTVGSSWTVTLGTILTPGTTHRDMALTNLATYYYRLDARDTSLNASALSVEVSTWPRSGADTTPPAAPGGLGVASPGTGQRLNLTWTANTEGDLKDYRIHRSTNPGVVVGGTQTVVSAVLATPGTTHQDAGLVNGTTYYYRLTARDATGNESGGGTEVSGVVTDTTAPGAPAGLTMGNGGNGAGGAFLNLAWTANTEGDRKDYGVYRATATGALATKSLVRRIASSGTTHQDGGLTLGTTYYYQLTARDASGNESAGSSEVSGTPQDTLAPAAPTGLGTASPGTGQVLNLTWTANTEADRKDYGIYRATFTGALGTKALVRRVTQPGTTHQDAGLANGTTYYYQLTARDTSDNESGGGTEVSGLVTDTTAPGAPAGMGLGNGGNGAGGAFLNLSWTANTESDRKDYGVYKATFTGALGTKTLVTRVVSPGTTHQDGGLTLGTTYYYQVTVRDASGNESGGSTESSIFPGDSTPPAVPTGMGISSTVGGASAGGRLSLSWTQNTEGDMKDYGVYRATVTGALGTKAVVARVAQPGTTAQDPGLANGTTYYYQLTARDVSGNESGGSTEVSGTPQDTTAPGAPTGFGVSGSTNMANLSWTANTEGDLKDYGVYRATWAGASPAPTPTRIAAPGTTDQAAGLTNGATYYFRLTARDVSLNESGYSTEASAVPVTSADVTPPAAPVGLGTGDSGTGQRLRLSWTANTESDLKDYGMYRATWAGASPAPTPTRISAPGTTHQDAGLTNGTTYYFRLTARDVSLNESGFSSEVSGTPMADLTLPGPITVLEVKGGGSPGQISVTWTAVGDDGTQGGSAASYIVRVATYPITTVAEFNAATLVSFLSPVTPAAPGTTQSGTIGGLTPGTRYYVSIVAVDDSLDTPGGNAGLPALNPPVNNAVATPVASIPTPPPPLPPKLDVTVTQPASTGGSQTVTTTLTPGGQSVVLADVLTISGTGGTPDNTIELRFVNKKTGEVKTVSAKVDANGKWTLTTVPLADGDYEVQARQVTPGGLTSDWAPAPAPIVTVDAVPEALNILRAGPNPFTPAAGGRAVIGFELPESAVVSISVFAQDGHWVNTLLEDQALAAGRYYASPGARAAVSWDGLNSDGVPASSGIYLIRLKVGDRVFIRKLLLVW